MFPAITIWGLLVWAFLLVGLPCLAAGVAIGALVF